MIHEIASIAINKRDIASGLRNIKAVLENQLKAEETWTSSSLAVDRWA